MEIKNSVEDNLKQDENPHLYVRKQCFAYVKKNRRTRRTGRSWQADDDNMSRGQTDSWFVATSDFCSKVGRLFRLVTCKLQSIYCNNVIIVFFYLI